MNIKRNIFILFIAVIFLITTYVIYNKKDNSINTENSEKKIWNISQEEIIEIYMENKAGKFCFQKSEEQWNVTEPANLKFDKMRIDGILYTMANLDIKDIIDNNPIDIEQFGLEKPSSITVKMKDGTEDILEIGNITALKDGYYVKIKNEPTVYKVNTGVGEELLQGNEDFRNRRLFEFMEEEFNGFQMKKEDKTMISIEKNGVSWEVEPAVEGDVDIKRLEPIINTLSYLCVSDYVEDDAKYLDQYGLDKPAYTINLKTTRFNKTLYLGNEIEKEKEQYIYGRLDGSNDVVIFKLKDISFLDNPSRSGFNFLDS